jgi:hypothetical protein
VNRPAALGHANYLWIVSRMATTAAHSSLTAAVCGPSTLRYLLLLLLLLLSVVFVLLRELVTRTASICSTPVHRGSVLFFAVLSF